MRSVACLKTGLDRRPESNNIENRALPPLIRREITFPRPFDMLGKTVDRQVIFLLLPTGFPIIWNGVKGAAIVRAFLVHWPVATVRRSDYDCDIG